MTLDKLTQEEIIKIDEMAERRGCKKELSETDKEIFKITAYEQELLRLASTGNVKIYTPEENIAIQKEMNEGMYEFSLNQRNREIEAALELQYIHINR